VERRPLNRRRVAAVVAFGIVIAGAAFYFATRQRPEGTGILGRQVRAPADTRIRVEVMNATKTRGLARRATAFLRDRGFDVVAVGTVAEARDSTLVLDRSGHPEWAALVARSLGNARVESRPDSSRYLDVTVLLGTTWRPPTEPFYP
jgi:hypothetical protein